MLSQLVLGHGAWLKWLGAGALGVAACLVTWLLGSDPDAFPLRLWARYVAYLDARLAELFLKPTGKRIAGAQLGGVLILAVGGLVGLPYWYGFEALALIGPAFYLNKRKKDRLAKLESQVEPFTLALANALKTTPSIGNALGVLERMLPAPIQEELDLVLKELRVGSTLEQSLMNMAARTRCIELEASLAAILVGRQVGGNLPEILGTTASTLREVARLAGIVRTKTASGRTQLYVLALAPAVVLVAFEVIKPGYFQPLGDTAAGWATSLAIATLWLVGIALARAVMQVDI
jgi:tight adherence protein B